MSSPLEIDSLNYCPKCGYTLEYRGIEGRTRAYCPKCDQPIYRNAKPCAGVLVIEGTEVLLVQRSQPPAVGAWSIPAGYLEVDEPPAAAAVRELNEETGVRVNQEDIDLFETNLVQLPDGKHVLVLLYTASREDTTGHVVPGTDAADAQFWDIDLLFDCGEEIEPGYEKLFRRAIEAED